MVKEWKSEIIVKQHINLLQHFVFFYGSGGKCADEMWFYLLLTGK